MPAIPRELLGDAPIDHVGFAVRDLDASRRFATDVLGLEEIRSFDVRDELGMAGAFYALGDRQFEVLTFSDPAVLDARCRGGETALDHVAVRVPDLAAVASALSAQGVEFQQPARFDRITEPMEVGGRRHLWTVPATTNGLMLQLVQAS